MSILVGIQEYEAPNSGLELSTGAPLMAPEFCLPVLQRLAYFFVGRSALTSELWIAGGVLNDGTPVSGAGAGRQGAFVRLAGEAAEQLALRARPPIACDWLKQAEIGLPPSDLPLLRATRWPGKEVVAVAGSALPDGKGTYTGFSEGLAAHVNPKLALRHAVEELVERHVVRRWWAGAQKGRCVADAEPMIEKVLGQGRVRETILVELTDWIGMPVMFAASFDERGRGFSFGAAAGSKATGAAKAALRELGASEFGLELAQMRSNKGTPDETGDIARADAIRRDQFLESLVELGQHQMSARAADWTRVLSIFNVHTISWPLSGTHFTVFKAMSPDDRPQDLHAKHDKYDAPDAWKESPFGVPLF